MPASRLCAALLCTALVLVGCSDREGTGAAPQDAAMPGSDAGDGGEGPDGAPPAPGDAGRDAGLDAGDAGDAGDEDDGDVDPGDMDPPRTTLTVTPPEQTSMRTARFEFSADEPARFECRLSGDPWEVCSSPHDYRDLELGAQLFEVRAIDLADNVETVPRDFAWTVLSGPQTLLQYGPSGATPHPHARIAVTSFDSPVTYLCSFDDVPFEPCGPENALQDLSLGEHRFEIAARDVMGHLDPTPIVVIWTVIDAVTLPVDRVAAGYTHACTISTTDELYCWGGNGSGQLGLGDTQARAQPTRVGTASDWQWVSAGRFHTCGVRSGGALYCWGATKFGQAVGVSDSVLTEPTEITSPTRSWHRVATGDWHSCALDSGGALYCWGYNLYGRLGHGEGLGDSGDPAAAVATPQPVDMGNSYLALSAGAGHTCAIRSDRSLWCWGLSEHGQLGSTATHTCEANLSTPPCSLLPQAVVGGLAFRSVSAGTGHTCGVDMDGFAHCWGDGGRGQLGTGVITSTAIPQVVGAFDQVASGGTHNCGLRSDGSMACWGDNGNAQLGFGSESSARPLETGLGQQWQSAAAGPLGTCAISENALYCWGFVPFAGTPHPGHLVVQ